MLKFILSPLVKAIKADITGEIINELLFPEIQIFILPDGKKPERMTDGAIGFDAYARAIVSNVKGDMDLINPHLRRTLFNFNDIPEDNDISSHVVELPSEKGQMQKLGYRLDPGEDILVGIGFITAMVYPMFYWVAPRSGLATVHGIRILNAPGTVDPDYRGEAGVLLFNESKKSFVLEQNMRINQLIFQWAVIPKAISVKKTSDLPGTMRGTGGFGHTGNK